MLEEVYSFETLNYSKGSNQDFTRIDHHERCVLNNYFSQGATRALL